MNTSIIYDGWRFAPTDMTELRSWHQIAVKSFEYFSGGKITLNTNVFADAQIQPITGSGGFWRLLNESDEHSEIRPTDDLIYISYLGSVKILFLDTRFTVPKYIVRASDRIINVVIEVRLVLADPKREPRLWVIQAFAIEFRTWW